MACAWSGSEVWNVNPGAIARLFHEWRSPQADQLQEALDGIRGAVEKVPVIPALKALLAHHAADPGWSTVRPPLVELTPAQRGTLLADLQRQGFAMPGLGG